MPDVSTTTITNSAISLKTGFSRYTGSIHMDASNFASASDGMLCYNTGSRLFIFSPSQGKYVRAIDFERGVTKLAPVNASLLYYITYNNQDERIIGVYRKDSAPAVFTQLVNDSPSDLKAASDSTLWALGKQNNLYSYEQDKWNKVLIPDGIKIKMISAGSKEFGIMLAEDKVSDFLYTNKKGTWEKVTGINTSGLLYIAACADNSWWLCYQDNMKLYVNGIVTVTFPLPMLFRPLFSASSKSGCYCSDLALPGVFCAAYGVIDQPAESWPTMSTGELKAYNEISANESILDRDGIRTQYANLNAPLSAYYTDISNMKRPDSVAQADWDKMQPQVLKEIKYAISVKNLFSNIIQLNNAINIQMLYTYNEVVKMVELPDKPNEQPPTVIDIVMGKLLPKLEEKALSMAPPEISKVISIAMQILRYGTDKTAKKYGASDGNEEIKIACSKLSTALSDMHTDMLQTAAEFQNTIQKDWGKLQACGQAIVAGIWYWSTDFDVKVLEGLGAATRLNFYQTLLPVKWKIMKIQTILFQKLPLLPNAFQYTLMYKSNGAVWWWWVCARQDASPYQETTGPFPNQALMQAFMNLVSTDSDFFEGKAGWKLPVDTMGGYTPPPDSLSWVPYRNIPSPLRGRLLGDIVEVEESNSLLSLNMDSDKVE